MPSGDGRLGRCSARLDKGSKLDAPQVRGWVGSAFPTVGEASGAWRSGEGSLQVDRHGKSDDPEGNARRNGRRAAVRTRRYVVHNRLDRLFTFTYGPDGAGGRCVSRERALRDWARCLRRLRSRGFLRGAPTLQVPELHKDGVHYHLHVALPEYVPKPVLASCWSHGFVDARRFKPRHRGRHGKAPALENVRRIAGYVSKYVAKSYSDGAPGRHRYECAQGHQPTGVPVVAPNVDAFIRACEGVLGESASDVWRSSFASGWMGPPAVCLTFGGT
jgi:hypothetical protein